MTGQGRAGQGASWARGGMEGAGGCRPGARMRGGPEGGGRGRAGLLTPGSACTAPACCTPLRQPLAAQDGPRCPGAGLRGKGAETRGGGGAQRFPGSRVGEPSGPAPPRPAHPPHRLLGDRPPARPPLPPPPPPALPRPAHHVAACLRAGMM